MNYSTPITPPSTGGGGTGTVNKITFNGVEFLPDPTGNIPIDYQGFSGAYEDLTGKPILFSGNYSDLTGAPVLAAVATSGSYNDLTEKPVIPAAQVNSDWDAITGPAEILNRPIIPIVPTNVSAFINDAGYLDSTDIAPVGLSGNYADLINKPDLSPLATAIQNAANVGAGTSIFSSKTGTNLAFRTLRAGDNVTLSVNAAGEIVIASAGGGTVSGEANTTSTLGTGVTVVAPKNGTDLPFRSLLSSAGLTWTQETDSITITLHEALRAISALTFAADRMIYSTGASTFATTPLTAFARSLLDDANAAAMQNTLGLALVASSGAYGDLSGRPDLSVYVPKESPTFTGNPTAPTPAATDNDTSIATTAFTRAAMALFGLGAVAPAMENLNDLVTSGTYRVTDETTGTKPSGFSSGQVIITSRASNRITQILLDSFSSAGMWLRIYTNSGWSTWLDFNPASKLDVTNPTAEGRLTVVGSSENLRLQAATTDGPTYHSYFNGDGTRYAYLGKGGSTSVFHINLDTLDELRLMAPSSIRSFVGGTVRLTVQSTGLVVAGTVSATSDRKFKQHIRKIPKAAALSRILGLKAKSFFFTLMDRPFSGFIAQEVKKLYPNSVDKITSESGSHLVMTKDEIIADLVTVVQDQQRRLDKLEGRLNDLAK